MCLITFKKQNNSKYPLILIANRDEAYQRESAPIHIWEDDPNIVGGRDLRAGGTWLALTKTGRFAALTNQPFTQHEPLELTSRGALITNFLKSDISAIDYAKELRKNRLNYDGYNLIFGTIDELYLYDNVFDEFTSFSEGVHSVSNTRDDLSKYRQSQSKSNLSRLVDEHHIPSLDVLIESFKNTTPNPNFKDYPKHLNEEYAKQNSSIFIKGSKEFGTVSTTVIIIDDEGQVEMKEVRYSPEDIIQVTTENFHIL